VKTLLSKKPILAPNQKIKAGLCTILTKNIIPVELQ
jgi:hypothetical protein